MTEELEIQRECIRKKISEVRTNKASFPTLEQVSHEFERETEKRARAALGIIVEAMVIEYEIMRIQEVVDELPLPAMLGVLAQGDDNNSVAAVNLDMALGAHVVDLLMGGDPDDSPELEARTPGEVDRALLMRFINMFIGGFDEVLRQFCNGVGVGDLRCVDFEYSPLALNIGSPRAEALKFKINLDMGESARSGEMELILPLSLLEPAKPYLRKATSAGERQGGGVWRDHMRNTMLGTELNVSAELDRFDATVAEVVSLKVGQLLPLDPDALNQVALRVKLDGDTTMIGAGRLGALRRSKALKLNKGFDMAFLESLRETIDGGTGAR